MSTVNLTDPIFHNEDAARAHLEKVRWPNGVVCPHCGSQTENVRPLAGGSMGPGWYYCGECRDKFTVRVGSIFERSHIPLHKWVLAFHLMAASKKGVSAHQLHRMLGITYKSAWFMAHRIRESMKDDAPTPMGGEGKTIEADETYIGTRKGIKKSGSHAHKNKVVTLVERGGRARSFHVDMVSRKQIREILVTNAHRSSVLNTDEGGWYVLAGKEFKRHDTVNHSKDEYVRGSAHTNTVEGFYSVFKRGMKGIYQHCSERHLHRYLTEFDFRYSNRVALGINDTTRALIAIKGAEGKRLTYRQPR
jgi:transposase-like protein